MEPNDIDLDDDQGAVYGHSDGREIGVEDGEGYVVMTHGRDGETHRFSVPKAEVEAFVAKNSEEADPDEWSFWDLCEDDDYVPRPDGWSGAYNKGTAGEVWHSGGNHWNRTWVNPDVGVGIYTLINEADRVAANELNDMSRDGEDPEWNANGEIVDEEEVGLSDIEAEEGTFAYYEEVDRRQIEAVKRLLERLDEDYEA